ncbi:MAG: FG-GAP repeat protein, partial [Planctomycetes bacterium]|nr:FG-GAP repeat protein [Planctomycetota bacterium]
MNNEQDVRSIDHLFGRRDVVSVDDARSRKAIIPRGRKLEAVNIMVKKKTNIGERVSIAVLGCVLLVMARTGDVQAGGTLTLISNPTPAAGDLFGISVAAVGTNKIIVGAPGDDTNGENAGAAYLFDLSGTLLQTYTSPEALLNEHFGILVTGVGADKVLITAAQDPEDGSPTYAGRAYLFDLSGNLLESFTNPNPTIGDFFGVGVYMGN